MSERPNILLITCHDLGRYLGCYGVPTVRTPRLDQFAADGVLLTRAFCTAPQCSPARASLFTGLYPHTNRVMGLTHGDFAWDLHADVLHLAQHLRAAGYATGLLGIIHEAQDAQRCGFETLFPPDHGASISAQALATLARYAAQPQPFYLQLGYHEPHRVTCPGEAQPEHMGFIGDYIAPDSTLGVSVPPYLQDTPQAREELAELQGAIHYMDAAIGQILDGLRALNLEHNTLVLFTTDHGVALPRAKCTLYDPGIEVALLLRLPARNWLGGRRLDPLVSHIDVLPTLLELLNLPLPATLQGRSLLPLLEGQPDTPRSELFAEMTYHDYYDPQRCIRTPQHKLKVNFTVAPAFMNPSQSWQPRARPVQPIDPAVAYHPLVELYDLERDPWEQQNLADQPDWQPLRQTLLARLLAWMQTTADPLLDGPVPSPTHWRAVAALRGHQGSL